MWQVILLSVYKKSRYFICAETQNVLQEKKMTIRQKIVKLIYPILATMGKWIGKGGGVYENEQNIRPVISFYSLSAKANNGLIIDFPRYKGKKVLLVNTASDCGFTPQLAELQKLQNQYKEKLVVIGFPSNDYKNQEKGSDEEIATFCTLNFNVHFALMQKSHVLKGEQQNQVFQWLTDNTKNGWNHTLPGWNFTKYLVDENGVLTHYFDTRISPMDEKVIAAIEGK